MGIMSHLLGIVLNRTACAEEVLVTVGCKPLASS